MTDVRDIVRNFYEMNCTGDAPGAFSLMAPDIEWTRMWHCEVDGRGPDKVAEGLFKPLAAQWSSVSLRDFTGVHNTTGTTSNARHARVRTDRDGKTTTFRQRVDTPAIAEARV